LSEELSILENKGYSKMCNAKADRNTENLT